MDAAVLHAMDEVPREHFVAVDCAEIAYADQALPIACGQTISQPFVVAYMTEQLKVRPEHRVLEIGTGSGYQAAVLSRLAREVVTVERYRTLADAARGRLKTLGYNNVEVVAGDGLLRRARQGAVRAHSRHRRGRADPGGAGRAARGGAAAWCCRSGRTMADKLIVTITKTKQGLAREDLIGVRFVPLLPGKAREL